MSNGDLERQLTDLEIEQIIRERNYYKAFELPTAAYLIQEAEKLAEAAEAQLADQLYKFRQVFGFRFETFQECICETTKLQSKLALVAESAQKAKTEYVEIHKADHYVVKCNDCGYTGNSAEWRENWNWERTECEIECPKCESPYNDEVSLDDFVDYRIDEVLQATEADVAAYEQRVREDERERFIKKLLDKYDGPAARMYPANVTLLEALRALIKEKEPIDPVVALATEQGKRLDALGRIYSVDAVWISENVKTGYKVKINGELARILQQYPQDYKLKFLHIKEDVNDVQ